MSNFSSVDASSNRSLGAQSLKTDLNSLKSESDLFNPVSSGTLVAQTGCSPIGGPIRPGFPPCTPTPVTPTPVTPTPVTPTPVTTTPTAAALTGTQGIQNFFAQPQSGSIFGEKTQFNALAGSNGVTVEVVYTGEKIDGFTPNLTAKITSANDGGLLLGAGVVKEFSIVNDLSLKIGLQTGLNIPKFQTAEIADQSELSARAVWKNVASIGVTQAQNFSQGNSGTEISLQTETDTSNRNPQLFARASYAINNGINKDGTNKEGVLYGQIGLKF